MNVPFARWQVKAAKALATSNENVGLVRGRQLAFQMPLTFDFHLFAEPFGFDGPTR